MEEFIFMPGGSLTQTITVQTLTDIMAEGCETFHSIYSIVYTRIEAKC